MRRAALAAAFAAAAAFVMAQENAFKDAVLLGEKSVTFRGDVDVIPVGADKGRFRRIGFRVEGNDVEIFRVVVEFASGGKQDIATRLVFDEGERSRVIDLRGGKRAIRSVAFSYRTVGRLAEGRATVRLFGIE